MTGRDKAGLAFIVTAVLVLVLGGLAVSIWQASRWWV